MKKNLKKGLSIVLIVLIVLFSTVPNKQQHKVHADAGVISLPLIAGAVALLASGTYAISQADTEVLGRNIEKALQATGEELSTFVNRNVETGEYQVEIDRRMKEAMTQSVQQERASHKLFLTIKQHLGILTGAEDIQKATFNMGAITRGDNIRVDYNYYRDHSIPKQIRIEVITSDGALLDLGTRVPTGNGANSFTFQPSNSIFRNGATIEKVLISPVSSPFTPHTIDNVRVTNLGTDVSAGALNMQKEAQLGDLPLDYDALAQKISANMKNGTLSISKDADLINAKTLDDITGSFEEHIVDTNSMLEDILSSIANVPTKVKEILTTPLTAIQSGIDTMSGNITKKIDKTTEDVNELAGAVSTGFGTLERNIDEKLDRTKDDINSITTGISTQVGALSDSITATQDKINTGVSSITQAIVGIVVPTADVQSQISSKATSLKDDLLGKFNFITQPIQDIKGLFNNPKSLYDLKFKFKDVEFYVLPITVKPAVDNIRPFFNGLIVLFTIIGIYRRFTPEEVIA